MLLFFFPKNLSRLHFPFLNFVECSNQTRRDAATLDKSFIFHVNQEFLS